MNRSYYYHYPRKDWASSTDERDKCQANQEDSTPTIRYLHLGPSGDAWTGDSIFAAKHLQPDYVRSIPLDDGLLCTSSEESLLEILEENYEWTHQIYNTQTLPVELRDFLLKQSSASTDKACEDGTKRD